LKISLNGRSSHAAYPEQGSNPSQILGNLLRYISDEFDEFKKGGSVNKIVCTYAQMGNIAYGISPGRAEMGITVRSSDDEELKKIVEQIRERADAEAESFDGTVSIKQIEPFSATINEDAGTDLVEKAAKKCGLNLNVLDEPFPWSEDFGEFRTKCPVTLFGIGTGKSHPPLHSEMYDFNDRLIETGIRLFAELTTS
jgi:metal-dependent amidase/aminoacylase/carboxypeptidase family protein